MSAIYDLLFYWTARQQDIDSCVNDAWIFLAKLKAIHNAFSEWNDPTTISPIKINTKQALRLALQRGQNRNDLDNKIISQLGYSITLVTTNTPSQGIALELLMGCTSKRVSNVCLLHLPTALMHDISDLKSLLRLCSIIVDTFKPDDGRVVTGDLDDAIDNTPLEPMVGLITYNKFADIYRSPLPEGLEVITEPNGGAFAVVREYDIGKKQSHVVKLLKQFRKLVISRTAKSLS